MMLNNEVRTRQAYQKMANKCETSEFARDLKSTPTRR
jgi:hypothetical protein